MKISNALKKFRESVADKEGYCIERAKLDFALALEQRRRSLGMNYSAIAEKINTSAAYITKVFRGDSNLTIESMAKLAHATGGRLSIQIVEASATGKVWAPQGVPRQYARTSTATVIAFPSPAPKEAWKLEAA